ncbi:MAG: radical SAM protein [Candidatus Omnitrophica bacterium]|nr:radical SAM protein [Candidatus Omnitrophota bacterium]
MKIAFVHCPFNHKKFAENLKVVDEEFCVAPPIVLAYVAAIAERAGHKVALFDCRVFRWSMKEAAEKIKRFGPDLLAFRFDTYNFHQTLSWARYLKERFKIPVLAGGINFSLYPFESMTHNTIDYAIIGEAIYSLPRFLEVLERGSDFSKIPGLAYRNQEKVKLNPPTEELANFDDYPFPARHLLPNERYSSFLTQRRNYTIMLTTTGCPYDCPFCAIASLPYRVRSSQSVIAEIRECYEKYGIREIDFFDATFFMNRERDFAIFRAIQKEGWDIEWACRSRVDVVDDEILKEAAKAGCRRVYFGIESSQPEVLKAIRKKINISQIRRAIDTSHRYGIKVMGFFMVGNPGETKKTVENTLKFAKRLNLDFVQFSRAIAKPGTQWAKDLARESGGDYWREFILGKVEEKRLPTPWTNLNEEDIEKYTKRAYYSFYFRPRHLLRIILRIRSFAELWRYIRVGCRMLFSYFSLDIKTKEVI